jgi:putative intracellular protease/amidase
MLAALLRREGRRASAQSRPILPVGQEGEATANTKGMANSERRLTFSRPWLLVLAASVVLALVLSVGEATGVTRLVPTIIRIATGEGSLVIEVDDPSISVQLDGEDITITGAGIHELRLRPGTHKLVATKDGQPLRDEVVTIEHGGKQVVKVARQPLVATARSAPENQLETRLSSAAKPQKPTAFRTPSASARGTRVLIVLAAKDFYYPEFGPVYHLLTMHGVECSIAATTLDACQPNALSPPIPVKPNLLVADAKGAEYDAIYFCGGEGIEEFCRSGAAAADAKRLIDEALALERIVVAAGMGVVVLAEADVLRDRRAACYPYGRVPGMYARRIAAHGAVCSDEGVVEDGLFVTGRAPQNIAALGYALLKRLGIERLTRDSPATQAN